MFTQFTFVIGEYYTINSNVITSSSLPNYNTLLLPFLA